MNRRTALNLALAVAVAGILVPIALREKPPARQTAWPLVPVQPSEIRTIEYRRNGLPAIRLVRSGDAWRLQEPIGARADAGAVAGLLALAAATSATRMPAIELERFELDKPWASVKLEGHEVNFGASNSLTREIYVASSGHVHVLPTRAATALPGSLERLFDRRLFAASERPTGWHFATFAVLRTQDGWRIEPDLRNASGDDLAAWAERWREAVAVEVREMQARLEGERVDLDLEDGRRIALLLVQREPEPVLVRIDERLAYRLPRSARALLSPPGGAPADARD